MATKPRRSLTPTCSEVGECVTMIVQNALTRSSGNRGLLCANQICSPDPEKLSPSSSLKGKDNWSGFKAMPSGDSVQPDAEVEPVKLVASLNFPSGPLPLHSGLYINRPPVEAVAFAEITHAGCLICIKAPRRFGKTSLLQRVIAYGEAHGHRPCRIDLQEADAAVFDSLEALMRWFCRRMVHALGADLQLDDRWDPEMGSKVNAGLCLQSLLAQADRPLLLTINALEQVFAYPAIARDFLSMLRLWHERSKDDPLWRGL